MVRRIQKRLSEKEFGVIGIKGLPDELKAEEMLARRRSVIEKRLTISKMIEEKEANLSGNKLYLYDIAKNLKGMEGVSYEHKREISEVLGNKRLSDSEKVGKIKEIFDKELRTVFGVHIHTRAP
jgi:hypothetical protein